MKFPATRALASALVRDLDRVSIEEAKVPGLFLMETAARSLLRLLLGRFAGQGSAGFRVICGKGNNGGDGLAVARLLAQRGFGVEVFMALAHHPDGPATDDASQNSRLGRLDPALRLSSQSGDSLAAALNRPDPFGGVWIDALLGTGFRGPLRPDFASWIESLNRRHESVLSIDVPSGLGADSGLPQPVAVRASVTGTLGCLKAGFLAPSAAPYTGETVCLPIGWPDRAAQLR